MESHLHTKTRLYLHDEIALGPGKADVLEAIQSTGSISAAGKKLGMSYRRAWLLVDTMNRCFCEPLVETAKGGNSGGGAQLSPLGLEILAQYRALEKTIRKVSEDHFTALRRKLRKAPLLKQD